MTQTQSKPDIAILALGNELLGDDGVGIHAMRLLRQSPPPDVILAEIGVASLRAQPILEKVDYAIALDAAHHDGPPGAMYRFEPDESSYNRPRSMHDLGVLGVMRLMPEQDRPKMIILSVEPQSIDYRLELSDPVACVLPRFVEHVHETVAHIRREASDNENDPMPPV